jgi:small subunit ribosomal protein S20
LPCPESDPPPNACAKPGPGLLRTGLKRVRTASGAEAQAAYEEAVKLLDRAGQKNIIHKNAAARQKSRLAKLVATKK